MAIPGPLAAPAECLGRRAQIIAACAAVVSAGQASPHSLRKGKWNPMKKRASATREAAEILAIQGLSFIAEEPERLAGFLSLTGLTAERIRESASEPDFLAGVLEHMLADESLLIAFAERAGIDPADIGRARNLLGDQWERDSP
ncbi:MAG TPA: DUF3572 domain-containing protein [Xanthobacteraceae bacterium]|nr:DUF3572 domain-containing protein [Xanthobacteraceae bacterium]